MRCGPVEPFAQNRGHGTGKRLYFRTKRHANMGLAVLIHMEVDADCVCAFLVFSYVDKIELLPVARFLLFRVVCIGNERFASFVFGERLKKVDDLAQLRRIHRIENLPLIYLLSFRAKSRNLLL